MSKKYFAITSKNSDSRARTGVLTTPSGRIIETPAYAIVGTHAEVRCLPATKMKDAKVQLIIANTYHLWQRLGKNLNTFPGLYSEMNVPNAVIMTDSGGFQVFSLGFGREHGVGKVLKRRKGENGIGSGDKKGENLTRITNEGVFFTDKDGEHFLGPELSIEIQQKLGADIIFAFDECTSPEHDYAYQKQALARTHRWAKICLAAKKNQNKQLLFGIIQGGTHKDLRKESAKFISKLPFDGFGIGGSFGEGETWQVLDWVIPELPEEKPRHLLGIGRIEDIFLGVEKGIDVFDCVVPTREARHGAIWTRGGRIDIKLAPSRGSTDILEKGCPCPACESEITRGELRIMFKEKDVRAGEFATMHNVFFFNTLMEEIRSAIQQDAFLAFKKKVIKGLRE